MKAQRNTLLVATRPPNRSASTLLIVVICLFVLTVLLGGMLGRLQLSNRQAKMLANRTEAVWLAESAIERAVIAMQIDDAYTSETWQPTLGDAPSGRAAQVEIETVANNDGTRNVSVVAAYPVDSRFAAKVLKTVTVNVTRAKED